MAALQALIRLNPALTKGATKLFLNPTKLAKNVVQKQSLVLTAAKQKRLYGPETDEEKHDEVQHWINERYAAVALLPLIPAALIYPNYVLDTLLTTAIVMHTHWRLSGVAQDYIHGQVLPKIARPTVLLITIFAFGSICYFNYTDIGFANAARMLYTKL